MNPERFELFVKLGELHFTVGKVENMVLARKYFAFVLTINGLALRPLMGLLRTCEMLSGMQKENQMNAKIVEICKAKLKQIYADPTVAKSMVGKY